MKIKKSLVAIIIILFLGVLFIFSMVNKDEVNSQFDGDVLKVGYIIYSPSLVKDPATGDFSGFSYDIFEAVADKLGYETEWVEEVGWGTAIEGLKTQRYDVIGTQIWPTEARKKEAIFSISPMDSVSYAFVREGDNRFDNGLDILNSDEYTISILDGEISTEIASTDFPNAKTISLTQLSSWSEVLLNVVNNKADVTFSESSTIADFLVSHPDTLKRVESLPIRSFGNSFVFNKEDKELVGKWDQAIQDLLDEGEIKRILEKHGVEDYYLIN
jgi:polar amino acid transport system substrate-binding protein